MKRKNATAEFNRLYDSTYDDALCYTIAATGDQNAAQDILSETYLSLYKRLLKAHTGQIEDLRTYFFTCLKNSVKRYYSGHRDDPLLYSDIAPDDSATDEMIDSLLNLDIDITESQAMNSILIARINKFIMSKSEIQRRAFMMRFYYGYTLREISDMLGVPQSRLNNYIYRLLAEIRTNYLSEYISK